MLPVFDRPIIQYIAEEAVRAKASKIILVTSKGKSLVEDHFDLAPELEGLLKKTGKTELLKEVQFVSQLMDIHTVRQKEQLGLGHAVLMAQSLVVTEHFGVMLGDDLVDSAVPGIGQLYETLSSLSPAPKPGVVMLCEVPASEVSKYGICEIDSAFKAGTMKISRCIEKPALGTTNSRYAILGRYMLPRDVFDILSQTSRGAQGELQLTDALNVLAQQGRLYGCVLDGRRFDAGDRLGYLHANLHYYLKSKLGSEVKLLLKEITQ